MARRARALLLLCWHVACARNFFVPPSSTGSSARYSRPAWPRPLALSATADFSGGDQLRAPPAQRAFERLGQPEAARPAAQPGAGAQPNGAQPAAEPAALVVAALGVFGFVRRRRSARSSSPRDGDEEDPANKPRRRPLRRLRESLRLRERASRLLSRERARRLLACVALAAQLRGSPAVALDALSPGDGSPTAPAVVRTVKQARRAVSVRARSSKPGFFVDFQDSERSFSLPVFRRKKKVLIIMSDTGGGHRASAQALKDSLEQEYGRKLDVEIVDFISDYCGWPFNNAVENYKIMAKHPWMWKLSYYLTCFPPMRWLGNIWFGTVSHASFVEAFDKHNPDMVVSVHPLLQVLPRKVLSKDIPFVTVVTDLGGAHPTWFHRQVDELFVPSDRVEKIALRNGVKSCKIRKYGLPIRGAFQKSAEDKQAMRRTLHIEDMPTALLVGGGDGVGGLGQIAKDLAAEMGQQGTPKQILVVCGSNAQLKAELEAYPWPEGVHVTVLGYVSNMDEWMTAADCLVTKAGPGTIAEACARGLPVMLSSYLPGQEAGNVKFVLEGGFGSYSPKSSVISKTVSGWLDNSELLQEMSAASYSAAHPEATTLIAEDIGRIALAGEVEDTCA